MTNAANVTNVPNVLGTDAADVTKVGDDTKTTHKAIAKPY